MNEEEGQLLSQLKNKYQAVRMLLHKNLYLYLLKTGATTMQLLLDFPGWLSSNIVQHMNSLSGRGLVDFVYSGDTGQLVFKAKAAHELEMYLDPSLFF